MLSIIIPTYNEKENIENLVPKIFRYLRKMDEVIIVDDKSPDGTGEVAEKLVKKYNVVPIHRKAKLGLSSAVIAGIRVAKGDYIGVMDADFSHPPQIIPNLLKELRRHDIVIASRYIGGGGIVNWSKRRKVVSKGATYLARPLTNIKDPMSGFFFFRKGILSGIALSPKGFKICLEVIVKTKSRKKEIPYTFVDRLKGKSKMGKKEIWNYIIHLSRLYKYKITRK